MIWEKDRSEAFETEAAPLLEALSDVLTKMQIPFFFCACVSNTKDEEGKYVQNYVRDGRTAASFGYELPHGTVQNGLYGDEISRHYAITCGARVVNEFEQDVDPGEDISEDFAIPLDE